MSILQNQSFKFWKDVLGYLRRTPSIRGGKSLSKRDTETCNQAILMNAMILKDIGSAAPIRSEANLKRWCIHTKRLDICELDQLMKDITLLLRKAEIMTYDEFKHRLPSGNDLIGAFLAPVKDYLLGHLNKPNAADFRVLNQFVSFMTRICLLDEDFQEEGLIEYYAKEQELSTITYDDNLVSEIHSIVYDWFSGFTLQGLEPAHGPGSTAELGRVGKYEKFCNLAIDQRLSYLLKEVDDVDEALPYVKHGGTRTARVQFVAKNLSSMRIICMEPTTLMYFQRGCWDKIDKYMMKHRTLGRRIKIHDQTQNRMMSKIGSLNQKYATIDLSMASDSVSWQLVKRIFKGTDYYKAALLTRSTHADLPDGNHIQLHKFAPMGSALCFPTQCILFAAICEYVARKTGDHTRESYSVYGDDIIVYEHMAPQVVEVLNALGFTVNQSKSYLTGRFKESCGGEYFDGFDVTPLKISRKFKGTLLNSREPSLYTGLIELINKCNEYKFRSVRTYLISKFRDLPPSLWPLFDDGTRGIKTPYPTNYNLRSRTAHSLQCIRVQHGEKKSVLVGERHDSDLTLWMWHYLASRREPSKYAFQVPEDLVVVRTAPGNKVLRSTWTYDPCGSWDFAYQRKLRNMAARP